MYYVVELLEPTVEDQIKTRVQKTKVYIYIYIAVPRDTNIRLAVLRSQVRIFNRVPHPTSSAFLPQQRSICASRTLISFTLPTLFLHVSP